MSFLSNYKIIEMALKYYANGADFDDDINTEIAKEALTTLSELLTLVPEDKEEWNSVKDKLPVIEEFGSKAVLILDSEGDVEVCSYWHPSAGKPHFANSKRGRFDPVRVTHWKLITLPKQEQS